MRQKNDDKNRINSFLLNKIFRSINHAKTENIYIEENESLSIGSFSKIHSAISELNECLYLIELLSDSIIDKSFYAHSKAYYYVEDYFNSMIQKLNSTFSDVRHINFKFTTDLDKKSSFYINELEIERIVLSIVYCLVKNLIQEESLSADDKNFKISLREKIGKESFYTITITSPGDSLPKEYSDLINKKFMPERVFFDPDLINVVLLLANVDAISGTISYSKSKTLNKFVFTFPRINSLNDNSTSLNFNNVCSYMPNETTYTNLFSHLL